MKAKPYVFSYDEYFLLEQERPTTFSVSETAKASNALAELALATPLSEVFEDLGKAAMITGQGLAKAFAKIDEELEGKFNKIYKD